MKRLAMLEVSEGRTAAAERAVRAMARYYEVARKLAVKHDADVFYPASNLIAANLFLGAGKVRWSDVAKLFREARASVQKRNASQPDFWSLIAEPEIELYEAVARGTLPSRRASIEKSLNDVYKRSQSGSQWRSVLDTTRFVLGPYIARATPKARKAAGSVLDLIDSFVNRKSSSS
jgi:hypothetical protein